MLNVNDTIMQSALAKETTGQEPLPVVRNSVRSSINNKGEHVFAIELPEK